MTDFSMVMIGLAQARRQSKKKKETTPNNKKEKSPPPGIEPGSPA